MIMIGDIPKNKAEWDIFGRCKLFSDARNPKIRLDDGLMGAFGV